jgi:dolichol-phosphate mannosyltransferase
MASNNKEYVKRFIKFGIVGASGIVVNSGILWFGHDVLELPLAVASVFAVIVAIYNNFTFNDIWTWRNKYHKRKHNYLHRLWRYYLSASFSAAINYIVLLSLTEFFNVYYLLANLAGIFVGMIFNFLLGEHWVFKSDEGI